MISLRPIHRTALGCLLATTIIIQGSHAADGQPRRTAALSEKRILTALSQPVSIDFRQTPLDEAVDFLKEVSDIAIVLDVNALDEVGISSDTKITFSLPEVSLRSALRHLLRSVDPSLTFVVRDEVLLITTREEDEQHLSTRVYDVTDLCRQPQRASTIQVQSARAEMTNYDEILELVTQVVAPASWDEVGGPASIRVFDGNLIVAQQWQMHREVNVLLETLRAVRDGQKKSPSLIAPVFARSIEERAARARIEKALSATTPKLDFDETTLADVVAFLQKAAQIPILLDTKALEEVGIGDDVPVTFAVKQITLRSALRLLLNSIDPTFAVIIRDEALVITTRESAEEDLETIFYPVSDLTTPAATDATHGGSTLYDDLIGTCTAIVEFDSWDEVGGTGSIAAFEPAGCLVVSQTSYVHQPIAELLARLRDVRKQRIANDKMNPPQAANQDEDAYTLVIYRLGPRHDTGGGFGGGGAGGLPGGGFGAPGVDANSDAVPNALAAKVPGATSLPTLIQELVEPNSWQQDEATIHLLGNKLILRQQRSTHRKILDLIKALDLLHDDVSAF